MKIVRIKTTPDEIRNEIETLLPTLPFPRNLHVGTECARLEAAQRGENWAEHRRIYAALTYWARCSAIRLARFAFDAGDFKRAFELLYFAQAAEDVAVRQHLIDNARSASAS